MPNSGYDRIAAEYYDQGHQTSRNFDLATARALEREPFLPSPALFLKSEPEEGEHRSSCVSTLHKSFSSTVRSQCSSCSPENPRLLRVHADACKIPLIGGQFSAVVGFLVDPFMGLDFLAEAHRMLMPGGVALLTVPTLEWGEPLRNQLGIDVMTTRFRLLGTERTVVLPSLLHSKDRLEEMLRITGFLDVSVSRRVPF